MRIGDTVRRRTGPWTPAVHALLAHLAERGFEGAPRVHGLDDQGREILDYMPGEVSVFPSTDDDSTLPVVARLLRRYHDATVDFPADGLVWDIAPREPVEVICHGDVAPYNSITRDGRVVAFIDFDTAHPGPRLWDVAYAAYRFVPLNEPDNNVLPPDRQLRRLRDFCDAYGLTDTERRLLPETLIARLRAVMDYIRTRATAGHPSFQRHIAEGHLESYVGDIKHIQGLSARMAEAVAVTSSGGPSDRPAPASA